jgi:hypothetical protein
MDPNATSSDNRQHDPALDPIETSGCAIGSCRSA